MAEADAAVDDVHPAAVLTALVAEDSSAHSRDQAILLAHLKREAIKATIHDQRALLAVAHEAPADIAVDLHLAEVEEAHEAVVVLAEAASAVASWALTSTQQNS